MDPLTLQKVSTGTGRGAHSRLSILQLLTHYDYIFNYYFVSSFEARRNEEICLFFQNQWKEKSQSERR